MSITMGNYEFEGPYSIETVENRAGVYVILSAQGAEVDMLELGQARELRTALQTNRHYPQWQSQTPAAEIFIHYTPAVLEPRRKAIEREIRMELELEVAA